MPFSEEEKSLIEAMHADPRSDLPRLAYADWCEGRDQGDLAEFIRLMCREPYFTLRVSSRQPWKQGQRAL